MHIFFLWTIGDITPKSGQKGDRNCDFVWVKTRQACSPPLIRFVHACWFLLLEHGERGTVV